MKQQPVTTGSVWRMALTIAGVTFLFSFLCLRAIELQVWQGDHYRLQAEGNRFFQTVEPARRGILFDRYNEPLVWNIAEYERVLHPDQLFSTTQHIERDEALHLMATDSAAVRVNFTRWYRFPQSLAAAVGYIGEATAEDLQRDETIHVGQWVGKAGLELKYEADLRGKDSNATYEIDATGKKLRKMGVSAPQPGRDIATTLDPYLTEVAARALGAQRGAVVITDVYTGEILALTSQPSFNANDLTQLDTGMAADKDRRARIRELFTNPLQLFFNRAVSGAYPPGSIFKLVTALAGLTSHKVTADTTVNDEGVIKVGSYTYGNWFYSQYGRVEGQIGLVRAISRSNDIFFYKLAEWTGPEAIAQMAKLLSLGERTGIDLPAETRGLVPDPDWKQRVKHESWFLGNTYHFGIGQGDTVTSPVQIAQLTQAIANQGSRCSVSISPNQERACRDVGLDEKDWEMVVQGMIGACSPGGTAYPFFPYNQQRFGTNNPSTASVRDLLDAGAVACKTGTAEFGGADAKGYRKTHGWFTSFFKVPSESIQAVPAPVAQSSYLTSAGMLSESELFARWRQRVTGVPLPKMLTITVLVESDDHQPFKEGSRNAAPVAKAILGWMLSGNMNGTTSASASATLSSGGMPTISGSPAPSTVPPAATSTDGESTTGSREP